MRNLICIISILALTLNVNAQKLVDSEVPRAVKTKFTSMYPNITSANWEMENGKYEAGFKQSGTETSVLFEANGAHVQTEIEIPVSGLPSAIIEYAAKNLGGQKIREAAEITSADGTVSYEAEIGKTDYLFDANGKLIRKSADSSDNDDDK